MAIHNLLLFLCQNFQFFWFFFFQIFLLSEFLQLKKDRQIFKCFLTFHEKRMQKKFKQLFSMFFPILTKQELLFFTWLAYVSRVYVPLKKGMQTWGSRPHPFHQHLPAVSSSIEFPLQSLPTPTPPTFQEVRANNVSEKRAAFFFPRRAALFSHSLLNFFLSLFFVFKNTHFCAHTWRSNTYNLSPRGLRFFSYFVFRWKPTKGWCCLSLTLKF